LIGGHRSERGGTEDRIAALSCQHPVAGSRVVSTQRNIKPENQVVDTVTIDVALRPLAYLDQVIASQSDGVPSNLFRLDGGPKPCPEGGSVFRCLVCLLLV